MLKKRLILAISVLIVLLAFFWFYSHGLLEISIDGSATGFSYSVSPQGAVEQKESKSNTSHITKILGKGSYELLVKQAQGSSFKLFKTGGFLRKTFIRVKLSPENARQFVGDNPGPCMGYVGQALVSSGCGDLYKNLQLHVPATSKLPTYTFAPTNKSNAIVQGIVNIKSGDFVLVKYPVSGYLLYQLNSNLQLSNPVGLNNLSIKKSYLIAPYRDGFLVYSDSFDEFFYYSSTQATPQPVHIDKAADAKLEPYAMSVQNTTIAVIYTSISKNENNDVVASSPKGKTEVVVQDGNKTNHFNFNKIFSAINICGQNKLCLVSDSLEEYDISAKKPRFEYKLGGVSHVFQSQSGLIIVRNNEILEINAGQQDGYIGYSFGDYKYCGASVGPTNYTLCLINNKNRKVALQINEKAADQDSIDKKIAELLKAPRVKSVSIYGSFIFVSPELGEPVSTTSGFAYPDSVRAAAKKQIDDAVAKLNIDTSRYSVVDLIP